MHCSTNATPGTDTGARPAHLAGDTATCTPNSSKVNPRVCVAADGSVRPDGFHIQNKDNGRSVTVHFQTDSGTGVLDIRKNTCPQLVITCDGSANCTGLTVTDTFGDCSYTPVVNNHAAADPIIVTDNCCPTTTPGPGPKH